MPNKWKYSSTSIVHLSKYNAGATCLPERRFLETFDVVNHPFDVADGNARKHGLVHSRRSWRNTHKLSDYASRINSFRIHVAD